MSSALVYSGGGGIGDSLVSSVVAQALHTRFDTVDVLTLPGHRSTLERVPDYDAVLVDDGGDEAMLAAIIAARNYDACVVTWATARTASIPQRADIPIRVGQSRRLYSKRFTQRIRVRSEKGDVMSHWSDIQLDYARALDCDAKGAVPRFVPTAEDERDAIALRQSLGLEERGYLILHPTNAEATRRDLAWPTQGWSALARAMREQFGMPVLISGTEAERAIVDPIVAESGAISVAGKTGIGGFAALARSARAMVGKTTGSIHVAAAVGCPTVGIFPFQSDFPERWAPAGPTVAIVRPSFPCHPGDLKETCVDYACIANLDVPRIMSVTEAFLATL